MLIPTSGARGEPPALGENANSRPLVEAIYGQRRDGIRDDLRRFLREEKQSNRGFAAILNNDPELGITTNEAAIRRFLDVNKGKVDNEVVGAIEKYLDKHVRPGWEKGKPKDPPPPSGKLFEVMRPFFRMGPHKVRQFHGTVPGIYRFYAYSESARGRSAVCLGAIRFKENFDVEELQTAITGGATVTEEFKGSYIYRGDSLIAILRNKAKRQPKFYILSIPSYNAKITGKRQYLTGLLIKTGEHRPVFGAAIHMIRNDNAFEGTNVVPRAEVDKEILTILDGGQWLPKR